MQSRSHRRGGDLFAGKSPIHNAQPSCTLFSNKPIVDTSLRSPRPNRLTLLSKGKGGPLKRKCGYGNEVWRTRDASPPHTVHAAPRGRSRNRWLIADCLLVVALWVYQNLKKHLHPQPPPSHFGTHRGQGLVRTPSPNPLPFHGFLN
jgi:hypothetical protein